MGQVLSIQDLEKARLVFEAKEPRDLFYRWGESSFAWLGL
jgi:hypothetical protein